MSSLVLLSRYYFNKDTQESVWERPVDFNPEQAKARGGGGNISLAELGDGASDDICGSSVLKQIQASTQTQTMLKQWSAMYCVFVLN